MDSSNAYLRIINITKSFGTLIAVENVSIDIEEGEFVCLLGPSGCGKTTLLRIIAGLEQPNTGQIIQAGKDITRLPPSQRDFGIVFQSYALFPNLTASQNIAYGLENRKIPRPDIKKRVGELLELVGLPDVGDKYPSQLSGGQQQRIALARALATSPGLLLLDEPLSALDARVRIALRGEIKRLQRHVGVTTVFVTHDQEEALTMADRVVVMKEGRIEQVGTPEEIYRSPDTTFVADFVGAMNFLPSLTGPGEADTICDKLRLSCSPPHSLSPNTPVLLAVRPEDIRIGHLENSATNLIKARVEEIQLLGSFYRLNLVLDGVDVPPLIAEVSTNLMRDLKIKEGSSLEVHFPPELLRVYPDHSGRLI